MTCFKIIYISKKFKIEIAIYENKCKITLINKCYYKHIKISLYNIVNNNNMHSFCLYFLNIFYDV